MLNIRGKVFLLFVAVFLATAGIFLVKKKQALSSSYLTPPAHQRTEAYNALQAWAWQRSYPFGRLPAEGVTRAFDRKQILAKGSAINGSAWESMGPHNIAGRMLAIAFNPQNPSTLFAGSASGGLWRSNTEGKGANAWRRVALGFPAMAVSAIAISPADSNTLYIGTGEVYRYQETKGGSIYRPTRGSYGIGVLKSTDGGNTWVKSLDWSKNQSRGVQMLRLDPANPETVWAATTEGVYVSRDAGDSWSKTLDVIMATDLVVSFEDPDVVVAACGNQETEGLGVYRTTDGGASWQKLTSGWPESYIGKTLLSMHPKDPDIIYASIGDGIFGTENNSYIARTLNGGDDWEIVSSVNHALWQGWFAHFVGVHPQHPDTVIAGGIHIWRSFDGGFNLERVSGGGLGVLRPEIGAEFTGAFANYAHPDHHAMAFHPADPNTFYIANDGGIFYTNDLGESFKTANGGLQTTQFYNGVSSAPSDSLFLLGGLQDNGTVQYQGTKRWQFVFGGDGSWTAIHPTSPDTAFVSYQWLAVSRSLSKERGTDGVDAYTWEDVTPPDRDPTNTGFIAPFVMAPSRPQRLYAARNVVYRTENFGDAWWASNNGQPLDGNPVHALAVSPTNSDVVFAATAPWWEQPTLTVAPPGMYVTRDAGSSWQNATSGLPDRIPMDIAVHPKDDRVAIAVYSGFGASHVYRTNDSGISWQAIDGELPDIPTNAVVFDPMFPDTAFVGNDLGVYVTRNGGFSWSVYDEGLPEAIIAMDLSISESDRKLRVATHGNGMYQRQLVRNQDEIEELVENVETVTLAQNFPNPFSLWTMLEYGLPESQHVKLEVYDAVGRLVKRLVDGELQAGRHRILFRADGLSSGVYYCRLSTPSASITKQLVVVR